MKDPVGREGQMDDRGSPRPPVSCRSTRWYKNRLALAGGSKHRTSRSPSARVSGASVGQSPQRQVTGQAGESWPGPGLRSTSPLSNREERAEVASDNGGALDGLSTRAGIALGPGWRGSVPLEALSEDFGHHFRGFGICGGYCKAGRTGRGDLVTLGSRCRGAGSVWRDVDPLGTFFPACGHSRRENPAHSGEPNRHGWRVPSILGGLRQVSGHGNKVLALCGEFCQAFGSG